MAERELPEPQDDQDRAILALIEEHGWAVISIPEDDEGPGFSFTVGLYHTLGVPELFIMGQKPENAHGLLNNAGEEMRGGRRFTPGERTADILEGYDAVLIPVDRRYYRAYFGYAGWFYRGPDFPVLQIVWPDRDGRFPWDEAYPAVLFERQRILGATDRWPHGWPFPDPPNAATFTSRQVVHENQPIRLVTHDEDGSWQFHSGDPVKTDDAMIVGLEQMVRLDPSLVDLGDLPGASRATRAGAGAPWKRDQPEG